jgi:hypothetical protein
LPRPGFGEGLEDDAHERKEAAVVERTVRKQDRDTLANFLGWFSMGLGTAQVIAPRAMCRLVGADDDGMSPLVMRLMGVREITQGVGILVRPRPTVWLWSRVAGDGLDLSLLGAIAAKKRRARTAFAIAGVAGVTVPDVLEALHLTEKKGEPRRAKRMRKSVTIAKPQEDVENAFNDVEELRRKVEDAGADVRFEIAPGGRGTEIVVEWDESPPLGELGALARKVSGNDLATQLSDDLRRLKQELETGEVMRSDGVPEGHRLSQQLEQRPAQPLEEAAR